MSDSSSSAASAVPAPGEAASITRPAWRPLADASPDALGESPFWHPAEGRLYWVDIAGRRLRRTSADGRAVEDWALPSEPGCVAPAASGGFVVALRDGVWRARTWGGALELLARFPHDTATTRANDGRVDPLGRLWVGTVYEPKQPPNAALWQLVCARRDDGEPATSRWTLRREVDGVVTSNGLAFSPDGRTAYWADTAQNRVWAFDRDMRTGDWSHRRVFHSALPKPRGWQPATGRDAEYAGRPDGAAVDEAGCYWNAMYEGGAVVRFSPAGDVLERLELPARCPTMPCFGGADRRTLYVTTARHGRPVAELDALPDSGRVFLTRVEVPGLPVNFFAD